MNLEKIKYSTEITVFQLRAARAALKFSLRDLADITGLRPATIQKLESGDLHFPPKHSNILTVAKVRTVLEENGIEFYQKNFIRLIPIEERFTIRIVQNDLNSL